MVVISSSASRRNRRFPVRYVYYLIVLGAVVVCMWTIQSFPTTNNAPQIRASVTKTELASAHEYVNSFKTLKRTLKFFHIPKTAGTGALRVLIVDSCFVDLLIHLCSVFDILTNFWSLSLHHASNRTSRWTKSRMGKLSLQTQTDCTLSFVNHIVSLCFWQTHTAYRRHNSVIPVCILREAIGRHILAGGIFPVNSFPFTI
jgi:hypothetical protein